MVLVLPVIVNVAELEVPPPGAGLNTVTLAVPPEAISALLICAVSCPLLTKVVVRGLPFQLTTELATKPVPFTVSTKLAPPTAVDEGLSVVIVGTGLPVIVNVAELDVPPPGVGLNTVTLAVPADAISVLLICAVSCPLLTNVVVRGLPFQLTTELDTKFDPFTVSTKLAPPTAVYEGLIVVMAGTGFATPLYSYAPMSQRVYCGRRMPR